MNRVFGMALAAMLLNGATAEPIAVDLQIGNTNELTRAQLSWTSDTDTFYEIWTSTNLADQSSWILATDYPIISRNLATQVELFSADTSRFFQVRKLDTQGPVIGARYPGPAAAGVLMTTPLTVTVSDPSGINTNSFSLTINGTNTLTNGSAGVTVTDGQFVFDPGIASWAVYGSTVTVAFACSDLKGNPVYSEWVFMLEIQAQVAGNLLHLPAAAPLKDTPVRLAMRVPPGVTMLGGLEIVEFLSDRIVFSYSGDHGLYVGAILVSHDPSRPFYRRILSLAAGPGDGQITAMTEDVPLVDIVEQGSFSPEVFIPVGGEVQALWGDADLGVGIPFSYNQELAAGVIEWPNIRLRPNNLAVDLTGNLLLDCEIRNWQVVSLGAHFEATFDAQFRSGIDIYDEIEFLSRTKTLAAAPLGSVGGFIGPVPVWINLELGVDLVFEVTAEGTVSFDSGFDVTATAQANMDWTPAAGVTSSYGGSFNVTPVPLEIEAQLSAEANLFLKPRLSALAYSVGGASLDFRRGPGLEISYTVGDPQAEITLYDKWSINGELTVVGLSGLPKVTFLESTTPILTWYWPEVPLSPPSFTKHPASGTYASGASVTLSVSASGNPAPTYQWYQNGVALFNRTIPTLTFTMGSSSVGTYTCKATNSRGAVTSQSATVSLQQSAPSGMALIPAGSFQMGDNLDGSTSAMPVHTVYVSGFYMDKYEVTKATWDEVANWAASNGYDLTAAGASGKDSSHPAQDVTWYECVKWCNARSQKEGLTPCYTVGGAVYKTGDSAPDCNWSANGYRLPTEAEWEKAARGGLSSRRFPWGNTINHDHANYCADSAFSYDTSPYTTYTYHPSYNDGTVPYTSPVGSFAANGYGLYDMAGNVWEWCWDWHDSFYYSGSPGSDPRGPSSGAYRVFRGGGWYAFANYCRVADRGYSTPTTIVTFLGFRPVRRAP